MTTLPTLKAKGTTVAHLNKLVEDLEFYMNDEDVEFFLQHGNTSGLCWRLFEKGEKGSLKEILYIPGLPSNGFLGHTKNEAYVALRELLNIFN